MAFFPEKLHENLGKIRELIQRAAERAKRSPKEITLVAVTKTVSAKAALTAAREGLIDLGENRVQALLSKKIELSSAPEAAFIRWHLIGNLQTNKINAVLGKVSLFHAIDTLSLANALETRSERERLSVEALFEVNISGEASKHGFSPEELFENIEAIKAFRSLKIRGLMTMAPFTEDETIIRPIFRKCREYRDRLAEALKTELPYLSMGMSQDYPIAIEEGATHVRIGSSLFEGVESEG